MLEHAADQFPALPVWAVPFRLALATLLGALIGLDREARNKPAGLRTYALVALGSAGFVLCVVQGAAVLPVAADATEFDPTGLISAVAGGIGFLGAGAIINDRGNTRGITTAAGIWICGAIGAASGAGQTVLAVTIAGLALVIIVGLRRAERYLARRDDVKQPSTDRA